MTQAATTKFEAEPYCPVFQEAIELIGRRWTASIVRSMLAGSSRFGAILETVPGLSDRLLAERFRELERHGIVDRSVYPDRPVRVEYTLTDKGREMGGIILAVASWAERWNDHGAGAKGSHQMSR